MCYNSNLPSGIQDIFDKTNVWVEIPTDGSQTIKLYGLEDSLSPALSLLFEKANSIKTCDVECPAWLLKYVIGKNVSAGMLPSYVISLICWRLEIPSRGEF